MRLKAPPPLGMLGVGGHNYPVINGVVDVPDADARVILAADSSIEPLEPLATEPARKRRPSKKK
jgi:hypothetical protein